MMGKGHIMDMGRVVQHVKQKRSNNCLGHPNPAQATRPGGKAVPGRPKDGTGLASRKWVPGSGPKWTPGPPRNAPGMGALDEPEYGPGKGPERGARAERRRSRWTSSRCGTFPTHRAENSVSPH